MITLITTSNNPNRLLESIGFPRLAPFVPGVDSPCKPTENDFAKAVDAHSTAWKRADS